MAEQDGIVAEEKRIEVLVGTNHDLLFGGVHRELTVIVDAPKEMDLSDNQDIPESAKAVEEMANGHAASPTDDLNFIGISETPHEAELQHKLRSLSREVCFDESEDSLADHSAMMNHCTVGAANLDSRSSGRLKSSRTTKASFGDRSSKSTIAPSLRTDGVYHAFISYCRRNKDAAQELVDELEERGLSVWADWQDIPPCTDWRHEIRKGIDMSMNVVFLLSPEWLESGECRNELDVALETGKRLFPVICKPVSPSDVPPVLASINWISLDTFDTGVDALMDSLLADTEYVKTLTRIQARAHDWDAHNREPKYVLSAGEIQEAEQMLTLAAMGHEPRPSPIVAEYVSASRQHITANTRRRTIILSVLLFLSVACLAVAIAFVAVAVQARNNAYAAQEAANQAAQAELAARINAEKQQYTAEVRQICETSLNLQVKNPAKSILFAVECVRFALTTKIESTLTNGGQTQAENLWAVPNGARRLSHEDTDFDGFDDVTPPRRMARLSPRGSSSAALSRHVADAWSRRGSWSASKARGAAPAGALAPSFGSDVTSQGGFGALHGFHFAAANSGSSAEDVVRIRSLALPAAAPFGLTLAAQDNSVGNVIPGVSTSDRHLAMNTLRAVLASSGGVIVNYPDIIAGVVVLPSTPGALIALTQGTVTLAPAILRLENPESAVVNPSFDTKFTKLSNRSDLMPENSLNGVTIIDHTDRTGNAEVIAAKNVVLEPAGSLIAYRYLLFLDGSGEPDMAVAIAKTTDGAKVVDLPFNSSFTLEVDFSAKYLLVVGDGVLYYLPVDAVNSASKLSNHMTPRGRAVSMRQCADQNRVAVLSYVGEGDAADRYVTVYDFTADPPHATEWPVLEHMTIISEWAVSGDCQYAVFLPSTKDMLHVFRKSAALDHFSAAFGNGAQTNKVTCTAEAPWRMALTLQTGSILVYELDTMATNTRPGLTLAIQTADSSSARGADRIGFLSATLLAAADQAGAVGVFRLPTGSLVNYTVPEEYHSYRHAGDIFWMTWDSALSYLITVGVDEAISIWTLPPPAAAQEDRTGPVRPGLFSEEPLFLHWTGSQAKMSSPVYSSDGLRLAVVFAGDGVVRVWNTSAYDQAPLTFPCCSFEPIDDGPWVDFSPNSRFIATWCPQETFARVYDLMGVFDPVNVSTPVNPPFGLAAYGVAYSPDGKWLAVTHGLFALGSSQEVPTTNPKPKLYITIPPDPEARVFSARFSFDGAFLALGSTNRSVCVFSVANIVAGGSGLIAVIPRVPRLLWDDSETSVQMPYAWSEPLLAIANRTHMLLFSTATLAAAAAANADPATVVPNVAYPLADQQRVYFFGISHDGRWLAVGYGVIDNTPGFLWHVTGSDAAGWAITEVSAALPYSGTFLISRDPFPFSRDSQRFGARSLDTRSFALYALPTGTDLTLNAPSVVPEAGNEFCIGTFAADGCTTAVLVDATELRVRNMCDYKEIVDRACAVVGRDISSQEKSELPTSASNSPGERCPLTWIDMIIY